MMTHFILADVAQVAGGISAGDVGVIIAAIISGLIGGGVIGKKVSDSNVKVSNNPLEVSLREQYVRREEFAEFKGEMKADVREMRGVFDKAITLIADRDERLTEIINSVASGAYEGRRRLHDKVNEHSARLERMAVNSDVSKSIGKLGAAVMTLARKSDG
jgi:hypothetical protein